MRLNSQHGHKGFENTKKNDVQQTQGTVVVSKVDLRSGANKLTRVRYLRVQFLAAAMLLPGQ